jgi:hypothetical protein
MISILSQNILKQFESELINKGYEAKLYDSDIIYINF